jgi:hypothetical protein
VDVDAYVIAGAAEIVALTIAFVIGHWLGRHSRF